MLNVSGCTVAVPSAQEPQEASVDEKVSTHWLNAVVLNVRIATEKSVAFKMVFVQAEVMVFIINFCFMVTKVIIPFYLSKTMAFSYAPDDWFVTWLPIHLCDKK